MTATATTTAEDVAENIRMLADSAGAFIPRDGDLSRVRAARGAVPGYSRETWSALAGMGWLGLLLPESAGGLGLGLREGVGVGRLLGAGLVPEPVIAAICALDLLHQADPGCITDDLLDGRRLPVAQPLGGGGGDSAGGDSAGGGPDVTGAGLTGRWDCVAGGAGADAYVLRVQGGIALVARDAPGLRVTPVAMHDGSFDARLDLDGVAPRVHPLSDPARPEITHLLLHAAFLQGAARRAFEMTLDYLRIRRQFGVPIGSFQALQHRATDIEIQLALAQAAIDAAAALADTTGYGPRARQGAIRAWLRASGAARLMAREAVQMHGAIGYTDEADIGLFTRKIMVEAGRFGPDSRLRARFMDLRDAQTDPDHPQPVPA